VSFDTKYRPLRYSEVLGQGATIEVCKQIVREGKGFQQSYVFAGAHGGGKTTTARILARAMLCASPQEGEPCDECDSCKAILADASENFVEVDAATNSGKEHVRRITEEAQFGSFSGRRKIYLFDECFTEDTMLVTPEGPRSIKDLVEQRYDGLVATIGERGNQGNTWKPVTNWYAIADERDCVTLEFDNGVALTVTTDQEVFTRNRGWIGASALNIEDQVVGATWGRDHHPVRVRETAFLVRRTPVGKKKVYDVTVADTHSFFAYSLHGTHEHAVLAHNCHELSKSAMDAMLKPLEDNIRGTEERQLVCIFCTTEPNKMRGAIMSRCAPAFKIRLNMPEEIAQRLDFICRSEGLDYEPEVLPLIAEVCECHIRDSIKAVEGVSMLGSINRENVERYLHLDANALYLDLLESIGNDLSRALTTVEALTDRVSPATAYQRLSELSMLAYRLAHVGSAVVPSYWDRDRLQRAGDLHKEFLVEFAQRFSERPAHPSKAMLACDVAALHQKRSGIVVVAAAQEVAVAPPVAAPVPSGGPPAPTPEPEVSPSEPPAEPEKTPEPIKAPSAESHEKAPEAEKTVEESGSMPQEPFVNDVGVYIYPPAQQMSRGNSPRQNDDVFGSMPSTTFASILHRRVIELTEEKSTSGRPARRDDVGSS